MDDLTERERAARNQRLATKRRRLEVLARYGGTCACCGEDRFVMLTIDHVFGDGALHRKALMSASRSAHHGAMIYRWLINNGFPPGFQVLCRNCQAAKGQQSECPCHWEPTVVDLRSQVLSDDGPSMGQTARMPRSREPVESRHLQRRARR